MDFRSLPTQLATVVALSALVACDDVTTSPGGTPNGGSSDRISIVNDSVALNDRVRYPEEEVPVDASDGATGHDALRAPPSKGLALTLVAEVEPPSVGGRTLQATSVMIRGNFAIVGYGMAGPDYLGGVDVFNLTNRRRPRLSSSATFSDSDVFDVSYQDGQVHLAQSTNAETFEFPSAVEVLGLSGHTLLLNQSLRMGTGSFVTTNVASSLGILYATSGNTGGLRAFDPLLGTELGSVDLDEARAVTVAGGKVVVAQGMPGRLAVFDEATLAPVATWPFDGATVPESKTSVEVVAGKAFIGAGPAGVQVLSVETGAVLGSVAIPDAGSLGLDPAVVVTNSVSVDGDLVFISNGEAGVYVAQGAGSFAVSGSEDPVELEVLGRLDTGADQSANAIAFKNDYLLVAAGLGGLKIIEIER